MNSDMNNMNILQLLVPHPLVVFGLKFWVFFQLSCPAGNFDRPRLTDLYPVVDPRDGGNRVGLHWAVHLDAEPEHLADGGPVGLQVDVGGKLDLWK